MPCLRSIELEGFCSLLGEWGSGFCADQRWGKCTKSGRKSGGRSGKCRGLAHAAGRVPRLMAERTRKIRGWPSEEARLPLIEADNIQSADNGPVIMHGAPGLRNRISTRANNERTSQEGSVRCLSEAWLLRHYRAAGMEVRTSRRRKSGHWFRAPSVTTKNCECSSSARIPAKAFRLGCAFGLYL